MIREIKINGVTPTGGVCGLSNGRSGCEEAVDGITTNSVHTGYSVSSCTSCEWWSYAYPSPVLVSSVDMVQPSSEARDHNGDGMYEDGDHTRLKFNVDWSDDGITWTHAYNGVFATYTPIGSSTWQTTVLREPTAAPNPGDAHVHWRVAADHMGSGAWMIREIKINGVTPTGGACGGSNSGCANAVDGDTSGSYYHSGYTTNGCTSCEWWSYAYPSPIHFSALEISPMSWNLRDTDGDGIYEDGDHHRLQFTVDWSDDGIAWTPYYYGSWSSYPIACGKPRYWACATTQQERGRVHEQHRSLSRHRIPLRGREEEEEAGEKEKEENTEKVMRIRMRRRRMRRRRGRG